MNVCRQSTKWQWVLLSLGSFFCAAEALVGGCPICANGEYAVTIRGSGELVYGDTLMVTPLGYPQIDANARGCDDISSLEASPPLKLFRWQTLKISTAHYSSNSPGCYATFNLQFDVCGGELEISDTGNAPWTAADSRPVDMTHGTTPAYDSFYIRIKPPEGGDGEEAGEPDCSVGQADGMGNPESAPDPAFHLGVPVIPVTGSNGRSAGYVSVGGEISTLMVASDFGQALLNATNFYYDSSVLALSGNQLKKGSNTVAQATRVSATEYRLTIHNESGTQLRKHTVKKVVVSGGDDEIHHTDDHTGKTRVFTGTSGSWSEKVLGESLTKKFITAYIGGGIRQVTEKLDGPGFTDKFEVVREYGFIDGYELLTKETHDPNGINKSTEYTYHTASNPWNRSVRSVTEKIGGTVVGWRKTFYVQESNGAYWEWEYSPWLDSPGTAPSSISSPPNSFSGRTVGRYYADLDSSSKLVFGLAKVEEYINGKMISATQYISEAPADLERRTTKRFTGNPGSGYTGTAMVSQTDTHDTSTWTNGRVKTVRGPILSTASLNTTKSYLYSQEQLKITYSSPPGVAKSGTGTTTHNVTSTIDEPQETKVSVKTKDYVSGDGHLVLSETWILETSSGWSLATQRVYQYDDEGRVIKVWKDDVLEEQTVYRGPQGGESSDHPFVVESISVDGSKSISYYDLDHTLKKTVQIGGGTVSDIVTTYAESHESVSGTWCRKSSTTRDGLTSSQWTDGAGRIVKSRNEQGLVTLWSYAVGTGTGKGIKTTMTLPNGGTKITTTYRDGNIYTTSGTAADYRKHEYSYTDYQGISTKTTTGNIFVGMVWQENHTDMLGRPRQTDHPEPGSGTGTVSKVFSYDTRGRQTSVETKKSGSLVDTVQRMDYDDSSSDGRQRRREGLDYDGSTGLAASGTSSTDRIVEHDRYYKKESGYWWDVNEAWAYINTNASRTLQSRTERKLKSVGSHSTYGSVYSQTRTTDAAGVVTLVTTYVKPASKMRYVITNPGTSNLDGRQDYHNGRMTYSRGTTTSSGFNYSYDSKGRLKTVTDGSTYGETWTTYDSLGRVYQTYKRYDGANVETRTYDYYGSSGSGAGQVKTVKNANNKYTRYAYDPQGRVTHQWGRAVNPVKYTYNGFGRMSTMKTYRGGTASGWDTSGIPSSFTNQTADTTIWKYYTNDGMLEEKIDPASAKVKYDYHANGRMASKTLANGTVLNYHYKNGDKSRRLEFYKKGTSTTLIEISAYDRMGRPRAVNDKAGTHNITYHPSGGISEDNITGSGTDILAGIKVNASYGSGRLTAVTSENNNNSYYYASYSYSSQSRLSSVWGNGGEHVSIGYQPGSDRLGTFTYYDDGLTTAMSTTRTYDGYGRLASIANKKGAIIHSSHNYTYDALSQRTKATVEDGSWWSFNDYSDRGELEGAYKTWTSSSRYLGRTYKYAYDHTGNRKTQNTGGNASGGGTRTFTYTANNKNQYSSISNPNDFDVAGVSTYPIVKITSENPDVTTDRQNTVYFHKALAHTGRPGFKHVTVQNCNSSGTPVGSPEEGDVYVPKATETCVYDLDGNITSDGRWDYTWDEDNRLIEMETLPEATSGIPVAEKKKLTFEYDYLGRRIRKKVYTNNTLDKTERFVWHGWHCIAKLNGAASEAYVWGLDMDGTMGGAGGVGGLLMSYELSSETSGSYSQAHFPAYDGNGNIMAMVGVWDGYTGYWEVSARYEYDPFGNIIRRSGSYADDNEWGFSTKFTDNETGLVYYGYRYYNPVHGRFINRDPIGEEGGLNLYGFVGNNGVNNIDYLGKKNVGTKVSERYDGKIHRYLQIGDSLQDTWGFYSKAYAEGGNALLGVFGGEGIVYHPDTSAVNNGRDPKVVIVNDCCINKKKFEESVEKIANEYADGTRKYGRYCVILKDCGAFPDEVVRLAIKESRKKNAPFWCHKQIFTGWKWMYKSAAEFWGYYKK